MKVIINADDLGLNHRVNFAIHKAMEQGCITSSTILANSQCLDDVKSIVLQFPNCSFGVHLNITQGKSLTNNIILRNSNIIDNKGFFNTQRCRHLEYEIIPDSLKKAIFEEWDAQIQYLLNNGFVLSHIDGHHHCHTWYGLSNMLIDLMHRHNIKRVRNKYVASPPNYKRRVLSRLSELFLNVGIDTCKKRGSFYSKKLTSIDFYQSVINYHHAIGEFKTTNCMCSYNQYTSFYNENNVSIELMCHPGHPNMVEEGEMLLHDVYNLKESGLLINWNDI